MEQENGSHAHGSPQPRRRLTVARETLRMLGSQALQGVAGGTLYSSRESECCGGGSPTPISCDSCPCPTDPLDCATLRPQCNPSGDTSCPSEITCDSLCVCQSDFPPCSHGC